MALKINDIQLRKIKKMVRKSCCNYIDNNCLLLDKGYGCKCVQLASCTELTCNYFLKAILPTDKELLSEIEHDNGKKICRNCSKTYFSKAKNSRYCPECAKKIRLGKAADRVQKLREKNKNLTERN